MSGLPSGEEIHALIQQHPDGIALETLAQQYQVTPHNSGVLILLAQLLTEGLISEETRGEKLYFVAQDPDTKEVHA